MANLFVSQRVRAGPAVSVPYGQRECRGWRANCQADVDNLRGETQCFVSHFFLFFGHYLTHLSSMVNYVRVCFFLNIDHFCHLWSFFCNTTCTCALI